METPNRIWVWRDCYFYLVASAKKPDKHITANEYVLAINTGQKALVNKLREGVPQDKAEAERLLRLAADAIEFYQSF